MTTTTRPAPTTVTYTRLRSGAWGVRGPAALLTSPAAGVMARVDVTRRDGTTKSEAVVEVVWTDGITTIAAIMPTPRPSSTRQSSAPARRGGICDECELPRRDLTECRDSSGISGMCCPRCASMSRYERSFA